MALDPARVSAVVPVNDLESREAVRLLRDAGVDVVAPEVPWGEQLEVADVDLERLREVVLLVEAPAAELEARIRQSGRELHIVDHHLYARSGEPVVDRRAGLSALEQLVELLGLLVCQSHHFERPVGESFVHAKTPRLSPDPLRQSRVLLIALTFPVGFHDVIEQVRRTSTGNPSAPPASLPWAAICRSCLFP